MQIEVRFNRQLNRWYWYVKWKNGRIAVRNKALYRQRSKAVRAANRFLDFIRDTTVSVHAVD